VREVRASRGEAGMPVAGGESGKLVVALHDVDQVSLHIIDVFGRIGIGADRLDSLHFQVELVCDVLRMNRRLALELLWVFS
jgi:hypothetical protein